MARTRTTTIRLQDADRARLLRAASLAGLPLTAWIREQALAAVPAAPVPATPAARVKPVGVGSRQAATLPLGAKQELFARLLARLLDEAHRQGFAVRVGEVLRTPEQAAWNAAHCARCRGPILGHGPEHKPKPLGIRQSVHCDKLAVDLNLFRAGEWVQDAGAFRPLAEWWTAQHGLCRAGLTFGDPSHFSLAHGGRQ